jgi:hypothetical protein
MAKIRDLMYLTDILPTGYHVQAVSLGQWSWLRGHRTYGPAYPAGSAPRRSTRTGDLGRSSGGLHGGPAAGLPMVTGCHEILPF